LLASSDHSHWAQELNLAQILLLAADEAMWRGLALAGFDSHCQKSVCKATNLERFKSGHGSLPVVLAQMWEDLQFTNVPEAKINATKVDADCFLMAIHFLACHPNEKQREGLFKICDRTT
jgi:hypothetical protein